MEVPLLTESEHIIDITNDGSSSSTDDQQPHEGVELRDPYTNESVWNSVEFVVSLVLIAAAIIVLTQPRYEDHPQTLLSIWIIGYTCGCIATLPILCWRFWHYNRSVGPESIEEYLRGIRIDEVMDFFMTCFFVGWFVVFLWIFSFDAYNSSALEDTTTQFYWLCLSLLTFSFIRYVRLNLTLAMVCYILPLFLLSPVVVCVLLAFEVIKGVVAYIVSKMFLLLIRAKPPSNKETPQNDIDSTNNVVGQKMTKPNPVSPLKEPTPQRSLSLPVKGITEDLQSNCSCHTSTRHF